MLLQLVVLSLLSLTIEGASFRKTYYDLEQAETYFLDFIKTHNKVYETKSEFDKRFKIFAEQLKTINELNKKHELATFGINFLSDLTAEERSARKGYKPIKDLEYEVVPPGRFDGVEIPDQVDWRENNSVTPVKNQGNCGSCWAFSAVGTIESQVALKHKKQLDLAEKQIVDCDNEGQDQGCKGGVPYYAFQYVANTSGLMLEADYPYVDQDGPCQYQPDKAVVKVKGGKSLDGTTEEEMAKYVANYGPISVALFMSSSLAAYRSGIADGSDCGDKEPDHAVVMIGYGTDNGTPYWILKNSWGTSYGDQGYFKLIRGSGVCAITSYVAIVEIE